MELDVVVYEIVKTKGLFHDALQVIQSKYIDRIDCGCALGKIKIDIRMSKDPEQSYVSKPKIAPVHSIQLYPFLKINHPCSCGLQHSLILVRYGVCGACSTGYYSWKIWQ